MDNLKTQEFWKLVNKDCWMWSGSKDENGYGRIVFSGELFYAHRLSWEINNGCIPDGMLVCHSCDNPSCVNPNHLFLGSISDNVLDSYKKGRNIRGETQWQSKLDESDVKLIRFLNSVGARNCDIAEWFGVTSSCSASIIKRRTWKHV